MPGVSIFHMRAAAGFAAAVLLGGGINDSKSSHDHLLVSYVLWYGLTGAFVLAVIRLTVVIDRPTPPRRPTVLVSG